MQTFDDVARLAAELPEVTEGEERRRGHRAWQVADKMFAWERPFSKAGTGAASTRGSAARPEVSVY